MSIESSESSPTRLPLGRRQMLKLLGSGVGVAVLTACGQTPQAVQPNVPETAPAANALAPTAPAISTAATTIRFWTWLNSADKDNPRAQAQAQNIARFQQDNPSITVVEEVVPWQNIHQQLLQAVAAGTPPDVSRQLDTWLLTLAEAEALTSLDPFVSSWDAARKQDYVYPWDDTTVNGAKVAFRQAVRPSNILYYRTDLYEAAGFATAPRTMTELAEASKAVTKDQVTGLQVSFGKTAGFLPLIAPWYWSLGSDLVDPQTGKSTFHLDAGQQIFQWFQDMVYTYKASPSSMANLDGEAANQMFTTGLVAAHFNHSSKWVSWSTADALKGHVATTGMPTFGSDANKPAPANIAGGWTLVMPKGAQTEAAWKLMEFLQSTDAELVDTQVGGELPTRKSTLSNSFFKQPEAEKINGWLQYIAESGHPATTIKIKQAQSLIDLLSDAAQQIIISKADVKTALTAAAQQYDTLLA